MTYPFETKSHADDAAVARYLPALSTAFEEFKTKNDQAIRDIRKHSVTDVVLSEQVDRINRSISDIQDALSAEILDIKRANVFARSGAGDTGPKSFGLRQYEAKFGDYLRKGGLQATQDLENLAAGAPEIKALSTNVDSAGGFTVLPQIERTMVNLSLLTSPVRQVANVAQISGGSYVVPVNMRGAVAGWVGEVDPRAETAAPEIAELEFTPGEMYAKPVASQQMLDDSYINVEQWLASEIAAAFDQKEALAFLSGDGVKKPRGMLAYPIVADANWAWGKVGYVPTGAAGAFVSASAGPPVVSGADTLFNLTTALRQPYRANARFLMNRRTVGEVRKLKDLQGNYLWRSGIADGRPDTILGFPLTEMEDLPTSARIPIRSCSAILRSSIKSSIASASAPCAIRSAKSRSCSSIQPSASAAASATSKPRSS